LTFSFGGWKCKQHDTCSDAGPPPHLAVYHIMAASITMGAPWRGKDHMVRQEARGTWKGPALLFCNSFCSRMNQDPTWTKPVPSKDSNPSHLNFQLYNLLMIWSTHKALPLKVPPLLSVATLGTKLPTHKPCRYKPSKPYRISPIQHYTKVLNIQ
jgi:hypothetical protein